MNERAIFEAALDIADIGDRKAFLDMSCEGDANLRTNVDALLKSHDTAGSLLDVPAVEQMGPDTANTIVGKLNADDDDADDAVDLSFLQPSTKVGSIGILGHYEVVQVLGQGAFGIVFKAFDEKLHRFVAIKVMDPKMASNSPPRRRFLREARSAAAVKHDNIVQVYSVEEQPLPYMVMEFVDGQTLQQMQQAHGPFEVPELLHIARQIANGLAAAHAQSLIHRDIKPGNILVEAGVEQKVKITDFGLARTADDASLTRSGMISGTPLYMAPEQALGQTLDHRTDLFSVGSVLYELLTGRPPFRAPSTVAVLKRVVDDTPRAIQEIIPETPDWLVAIINKLLAKKPEERFQSAKEVADLLGQCQSELQLNGQVTGVPARNPNPAVQLASVIPPATATTRREGPKTKPSGIWLLVWSRFLFLIVMLLVLVLLFDAWRFDPSDDIDAQIARMYWYTGIGFFLSSVSGVLLAIWKIRFSGAATQAGTVTLPDSASKRSFDGGHKTSSDVQPSKKLTLRKILFATFLGVFVMSPILFGRHLNSFINAVIWPTIPALPSTTFATGLQFDGKDDFIQIPVNWSDPQFTIEAFVTTDGEKRGATVFELSNEEKGDKEEKFSLFEGQGRNDEQVSYAGTVGTTGFSNTSGPLTPDVREHRAITYDGFTLHFYLNGVWQGKRYVQPRDKLLWKMKQLTIGCNLQRNGFFRGTIDQLRVSKVARYTGYMEPVVTSVTNDDATLALYNFDEGQGDVLKDASGNGNDGRIFGATWVHPAMGLQFDGIDDSVEFNNLGWTSNQYTLEAWITPQSDRSTWLQIGGANSGLLQMYVFPGGSGVGINRDKPYVGVDGPRAGSARQHFAAVFDGQHLSYFIDGKLVGTKTNVSAETTPWTLERMVLGAKLRENETTPACFQGRIDQLRVSNTARYNLPFKPKERLSADESTLALYDFDQSQGDVVKDLSGHGHDGRISGVK